ncbi:uncharacterized protein [Anabrus simplex]|uniref:uncharacterized protein n=1 Tax=Anabrus simplex TaxID=316456 RepID=UPI0035A356C6
MEEPHFIKCEPGLLTDEEEEATVDVQSVQLPTGDDTLCEVKVEPLHMSSGESSEEDGATIVKEEYEMEDVKAETQVETCNTTGDTLQNMDEMKILSAPVEAPRFSELPVNEGFRIISVQRISTRYGIRIPCTCESVPTY